MDEKDKGIPLPSFKAIINDYRQEKASEGEESFIEWYVRTRIIPVEKGLGPSFTKHSPTDYSGTLTHVCFLVKTATEDLIFALPVKRLRTLGTNVEEIKSFKSYYGNTVKFDSAK